MSKRATTSLGHQIYPKKYFDKAPTWFAWNNLTAADVIALRREPGFEGQQIYFCLNHPIRFVRLVGVVVDVEVITGKHILMSLDDSSGACVEIKTSFRDTRPDDHATYPSNTVIDNLDVSVSLGLAAAFINRQRIEIGAVIKAKGTLDSFRNTRQLKLERIWVVKNTGEELKAWTETAKWKREVLSVPWILTQAQKDEVDEQIRREALKDRERLKKRKACDTKYAEKTKVKMEKYEVKRLKQEEKYNAGALPGSAILPGRVTDS